MQLKKKSAFKLKSRAKKHIRIRKKVFGDTERPRLSVFRSASHIYAQIIDDSTGQTLVEASTMSKEINGSRGSREAAKQVGANLAELAKKKNISSVVFDRGGYLYHGRIQVLADAAREGGLQF
ncbi:MAG: 50S ribosomal protein L18 [Bdellovibrionales bacterium RBG_16_40_8]|nr:MAG: 50S ribosomal protein L18 [Bdellovibrionales bacterium RBG_16_40_8]